MTPQGWYQIDNTEGKVVMKVPAVRIVDKEPHHKLLPLSVKEHPGVFAVMDGETCVGWWSADRFTF